MKLNLVLEKFIEKSPISVLSRGLMERILCPEQLDEWFEKTAEEQYTKDLLFSSVFDIMSKVVAGSYPSVHAAYQASKEDIGVSITSVYNKLNGIEVTTSAELVRYAASSIIPVIKKLGGMHSSPLPGYHVKLLDGNCIEATEHRIEELRGISAGPLPGKSLVTYDPVLRMPIDVFPCEDGHAQERSLFDDVLPTVIKNDLWIADRNFCTRGFISGIHRKNAYFIFRQHGNLPFTEITSEKAAGITNTGKVFEQTIKVEDLSGKELELRRIRVRLTKKTRDGDSDIFIITGLPKKAASAKKIADLYRGRWTIETAFQELTTYFNSEINTLGYPKAAIFGFCISLVAYIILAVVKAALCCVHGTEKIEKEVSGYYIANELSQTYQGMMIALPDEDWYFLRSLTDTEFSRFIKTLSSKVKLSAYKKHPRGPKKPRIKRADYSKSPHVSTAKLLSGRKK